MSHLKCSSASQSLGAGYVFVVLTPHAKSLMYAATQLLAAHCPPQHSSIFPFAEFECCSRSVLRHLPHRVYVRNVRVDGNVKL